ncbi:MAG: hypothetical protein EZS28_023652, partial [Streblomastix strix]
ISKITDFGLVKVQNKAEQSTFVTTAGTAQWMAPEILIENEEEEQEEDNQKVIADEKIDIWSAGIILHQLVAQSYPFRQPTLPAIIRFMITKRLIRPPSIQDNILWDLISKMLCFDRKERISASNALNHQFFTGLEATNDISEEVKHLTNSN